MVKKSKKSKSKRVPLKKKYKVIRKVKEHHKKKAKEAKQLGFNKKFKVEKDPGIPNDWPFKEQELKVLEARRQRAIQELEEKKAARKERILFLVKLLKSGSTILERNYQQLPLNAAPKNRNRTWCGNLREIWKAAKSGKASNILQTSDCMGAETLIKLLKNYSRSHYHDEQPPASTQNVADEFMESDEKGDIPEKYKYANRKQNKLYSEAGMLNTKLKKAEKKRLKKDSRPSTMVYGLDDDYDFGVDYMRTETATDVTNDGTHVSTSSKNRFEVPSGVELDTE